MAVNPLGLCLFVYFFYQDIDIDLIILSLVAAYILVKGLTLLLRVRSHVLLEFFRDEHQGYGLCETSCSPSCCSPSLASQPAPRNFRLYDCPGSNHTRTAATKLFQAAFSFLVSFWGIPCTPGSSLSVVRRGHRL